MKPNEMGGRGSQVPKKTEASKSRLKTLVGKTAKVHIALRIRSEGGATVSSHKKVITERGSVLFAKLGKGLGPAIIRKLNAQIDDGLPTYLFLAAYEGWKQPYTYYQCSLVKALGSGVSPDLTLVPEYLKGATTGVESWLQINDLRRISQHDASKIRVISSGKELSGAIAGTASVFHVEIKGDGLMTEVPEAPRSGSREISSLDEIDDEAEIFDDDEFIAGWLGERDS